MYTYDGTDIKLYVNGDFKDTYSTTMGIGSTTNPLLVGCFYDINNCINGIMDEVRISDTARDSNWITTSYMNQNNSGSFYNISNELAVGAPVISNIFPSNGAVAVSVSLSELSFNLTDYQGDSMNYAVSTSPDIGSDSVDNVYSGTFSVSVSDLSYDTTYEWNATVTDGVHSSNKTFTFTTES